jgi:periplasmic protein TonB
MSPVATMAAIVSLITHVAVIGVLLTWPSEDTVRAVRLIDIEIAAVAGGSTPEAVPAVQAQPEPASAEPPSAAPRAKSDIPAGVPTPKTVPQRIEIARLPTTTSNASSTTPKYASPKTPGKAPDVAAQTLKTGRPAKRLEARLSDQSQVGPTVVIDTPIRAASGNPQPRYPMVARKRGFEGRSVVRARVSASGSVLTAEVTQSSGHRILDVAAREAVASWQFEPAVREDRAIAGQIDIPIEFRLR